MDPQLADLLSRLHEIHDLRMAAGVLAWDRETYMPAVAVQARANQMGTLRRLAHQRLTAEEMGRLLDELKPLESQMPFDSFEASLVRVAREQYEREIKVPGDLVAEMASAATTGHVVWVEARRKSDFETFRPALENVLALSIRYAECFRPFDSIYDPLLDGAEPGMTAAELRPIFAALKAEIVPLVKAIAGQAGVVDDRVLHFFYPEDRQWAFGLEVAEAFGFDLERGRQDRSAHPFTIGFSNDDVRITTRVDPNYLPTALFSTLHETGHALYMQGHDSSLERTPLAAGASSGFHESQSRTWENLVGRSREFWLYWFPRLRVYFPDQLAHTNAEQFYRAVNKVMPSLVRVEADELTYNLHILLRFELELELLEGRLVVKDLPQAWNAAMEGYLGVTPPGDRDGVLQDMHWSGSVGGGFPCYSLGNIYGPQLLEQAAMDIPNLREQFARGEYRPLLNWYREHVYAHGRKFKPRELIQRITGRPLSVEPWIRYVKGKFGEIYGI